MKVIVLLLAPAGVDRWAKTFDDGQFTSSTVDCATTGEARK